MNIVDKAEAACGDIARKLQLFEIGFGLFIFSANDKKGELS